MTLKTRAPKTVSKTARKNAEQPHIRTLKISEKYSIQFHPDGRRDALLEGNQWISLDKDTICWDLVTLIVRMQEVHAPLSELNPL